MILLYRCMRSGSTGRKGIGMADLYDTDIVSWAEQQADALRRRATNEIDWNNVAEEIEDVARRDRDRLYGALVTAITHLLKWRFQPEMRSGAWRSAVVRARDRIAKLLNDSPSLKGYPASGTRRRLSAGQTRCGGGGQPRWAARIIPVDHRPSARSRVLAACGRAPEAVG